MSDFRRRSGCWTCKQKHVSCTEETPICSRCSRLNLDCSYGLRLLWKEDAVQRGISLGREGIWSKKPQNSKKAAKIHPFRPVNLNRYCRDWIFLNLTYEHFGNNNSIQDREPPLALRECPKESDEEIVADSLSIVPVPKLPNVSSGLSDSDWMDSSFLSVPFSVNTHSWASSSIEGNLFDYFIASISPSCSFSSSRNPYLTLIAPMSLNFAPLKSAVLAVSANQLRLLNDKRFSREALYHKSMALNGVQKAIDSGEVEWGVIATVLMLCFYDISDGCKSSWMTHLRGGLMLLERISHWSVSSSYSGLARFLRIYFVAHAIMSSTALEEDPVEQEYEWDEEDNMDEIDTSMGCSRALMSLIREIVVLASRISKTLQVRPLYPTEIEEFSTSRDTLERRIHSLNQTLPSCSNMSSELLQVAEVKRLCALLYLRDRLSNLPNSIARDHILSGTLYKNELISTITERISALPDSSTLLWPLFVLGNARLDEDQRRFVAERLRNIEKVRNLGSVRQARLEVEEAWKRCDSRSDTKWCWGTMSGRQRPRLISLA